MPLTFQWHSHGGPDEVPNGLALHHRLLDHGALTVGEDLRVARSVAGASARGLLETLEIRLPVDTQLCPDLGHLRWHHSEVFKSRM